MTLEQLVPVLQLAIGPVILLSGAGLILLSMTNRYGRVIDRSRGVVDKYRKGSKRRKERRKSQLAMLLNRAKLLRFAIQFTSLCLLLASIMIISLFLTAIMGIDGAIFISFLFILCIGSLCIGLLFFIIDVNVSLKALVVETNLEAVDELESYEEAELLAAKQNK